MPRVSMAAALTTSTATGTFSSDSARRRAVTTISSSELPASALASAAVETVCAAANVETSTAAAEPEVNPNQNPYRISIPPVHRHSGAKSRITNERPVRGLLGERTD